MASVALIGTPLATRLLGRNAGFVLAIPLLSAAVLLVFGTDAQGAVVEQSFPWMPTIGVEFSLRLDGLSLLFAMLVLVIGALVIAYSARYLSRDGQHTPFFLGMTAFAVAMLLLVLADDLVLLFVAWEATTLCSFFLIARPGPHARVPAVRTLLVTAAGGLVLLAAVCTMIVSTGTSRVSAVLADPIWSEDPTFTTTVGILIAVAAFTKSAQFPFQSWLPDSMVAISPVSAYLHAAAMVKAGIYLMLRFSPALAGTPAWTILLIGCGLITALFGAAAALQRYDLKELLAYSTMSQLGLLTVMIGVGTPAALTAAIVMTVAHALFKSSLFMLVGIVDHQAHTRDLRLLAGMSLRMPATAGSMVLAAASMAGFPPLLGFVGKESMFESYLDAPFAAWATALVVIGTAVTSVLTFAYSGRLLLGAFGGRGEPVREATPPTWLSPAIAAALGLAFGVAPFLLDLPVSDAASATVGVEQHSHLALWHGLTGALGVSAAVIAVGAVLVLRRARVDPIAMRFRSPVSGTAIVDDLRHGLIRIGGSVARMTGRDDLRLHLTIPMVVVAGLAVVGIIALPGELPPIAGSFDEPLDWVLAALVCVGAVGAVMARTRVSAILVVGIVGFALTLWYIALGAVDVALTQLLVEILTVCVMVLLLSRLPRRFGRQRASRLRRLRRGWTAAIAVAAGAAASLGVWALTGRRDPSSASSYYLQEAESQTGGANIVNTILVDFRALDTLGELTVLGIAGLATAALLQSRHLAARRDPDVTPDSPLADTQTNSVFIRTAGRALFPLIVVAAVVLLWRGHQEPGGGFISALVAGAGVALIYLAAPTDRAARIRLPYMGLIGAGVLIATATGLFGYLEGSFLTPLHAEILGYKFSSALIFDIGVFLAVIGVIVAAFNLLGGTGEVDEPAGGADDDSSDGAAHDDPRHDGASREVGAR